MTALEVEHVPVVVVGGGQAGLSVSWYLKRDGMEHVVLERETLLHHWRDARWDAFCLVTPNWQCQLPGYPYTGPDPDGFMVADELNAWLAGFPASFDPPVREHTTVTSVRPREDGPGFLVHHSGGLIIAGQVVVAVGGYHVPSVPRIAEALPPDLLQVHSSSYRSPQSLPPGKVLVVGTGQSGAQIAEDLHLAGRQVHLAVGDAPRCARVYRGRDVVAWLHDMGHYDLPVTAQPPEERGRDRTNHYVTGRDGGRDLDLRAFAREGMGLHGILTGVEDGRLVFADNLAASLDNADAVYNGINAAIDGWIADQGLDAPPQTVYEAGWWPAPGASSLGVDEVSAVVWATGFRSDFRWLHASVFDGEGVPQHVRGVTQVPGVYFVGLPWLHTWGSGRFASVARDAEHLAGHLRAHAAAGHHEGELAVARS
jgi:putative flavoprotein involved in K+ transport